MKRWILCWVLVLALTGTALAKEAILTDEFIVEAEASPEAAEPTAEDAGGPLAEGVAPEEAPEPAVDAPQAVGNGAVANGDIEVDNWDRLVKALKSAQNGDTIIFSNDVSQEGRYSASIRGKTITMNLLNQNQIKGNTSALAIFTIGSGGELVLKGGGKISNGDTAVSVDEDCRFMMESGRPYIITANVKGVCNHNRGVFTMKGGYITQNDTGVENYGAFIAGSTSGSCEITGNKKGVVTYFSDSTITVSGIVVIKGNTECDVLLQKGQVVAVSGPLYKGSRIGITLNSNNLPGPGAPVVVTKGLKGNGTAENFFVWGDYEAGINADGELEVSLREPPSALPANPDTTLLAKATASGATALKLSWTGVGGAEGYDVFLGLCKDGTFKKKATVTGARSCKLKGLKRGRTYQVYVRAWEKSGGKKTYIGKASPTVYAIVGGYNSTRCNPKSVTVKKSSMTLKEGKTGTIRASVKGVKAGKKGLHQCKLIRWFSDNRNVATVDKDGKVSAKSRGECTIYAVANNGVRASVIVRVE